jgi:CRISPR/Cas system-associated endonuclease Cas1
MLNNIFGGLAPSGNKTDLKGIGTNATKIGDMGSSLARIKERMILPESVSAQQVLDEAKHTGEIEAQLELAKEIVTSRKQQMEQLLRLHELNVQHTQNVMQVDERLRGIEAGHGKVVSRYQLGAAETQIRLTAYEDVYTTQAAEIFS